eukprot:CAMPEP_0204224022 /NCGR_PEP_ID=MMETSP0361-20130328/83221_1 /ASSEMBLY_ACC=CAM_ASM_000343 /TAXON_ID=268821 /ORGANISM="Scrippsiella Hangoei, Strain SHTV-5" /LENGTH=204 /DNA_ID=CAMNT_0051189977 /DNA_START=268 /DNA_END=883 /DNA_ORIENTATION=+
MHDRRIRVCPIPTTRVTLPLLCSEPRLAIKKQALATNQKLHALTAKGTSPLYDTGGGVLIVSDEGAVCDGTATHAEVLVAIELDAVAIWIDRPKPAIVHICQTTVAERPVLARIIHGWVVALRTRESHVHRAVNGNAHPVAVIARHASIFANIVPENDPCRAGRITSPNGIDVVASVLNVAVLDHGVLHVAVEVDPVPPGKHGD